MNKFDVKMEKARKLLAETDVKYPGTIAKFDDLLVGARLLGAQLDSSDISVMLRHSKASNSRNLATIHLTGSFPGKVYLRQDEPFNEPAWTIFQAKSAEISGLENSAAKAPGLCFQKLLDKRVTWLAAISVYLK